MAAAGGLSSQYGMIDETTFGTPPTVTRFLEYNSQTVSQDIARIESSGLRVNRRTLRSSQFVPGRKNVSGDIEFEVQQQGLGLLFKHAFGSVASAQPNVGSAPTVWEHTFKAGATDGKSFAFQLGLGDAGGVQRAFTYAGSKIPKWDLSVAIDGLLLFKPTIDAISEVSNVALAAATYAASTVPLSFMNAVITLPGGATGNISKFDLTADNGLAVDRYFMSATSGTKKEQLESQLRAYTGTLDVEFDDLTAYNLFVNGTVGSLTAFFTGANIASIYNYALEITMPAVRFDGKSPDVPGPGIVTTSVPFKAMDDGTSNAPITAVYRTTDATP